MAVVMEAPTMPADASKPPTCITDLLSNLLTVILDTGPGQKAFTDKQAMCIY